MLLSQQLQPSADWHLQQQSMSAEHWMPKYSIHIQQVTAQIERVTVVSASPSLTYIMF